MNPQNNSELPPIYQGTPEAPAPAEQFVPAYEQTTERARAQAVEQGTGLPAVPPPNPVAAATPIPAPIAAPGGVTPQIADDLDLIEKEWVEKAKAIVAHTKNDPRAQSFEMNRFKADYLRQRFNKDVKLEEA